MYQKRKKNFRLQKSINLVQNIALLCLQTKSLSIPNTHNSVTTRAGKLFDLIAFLFIFFHKQQFDFIFVCCVHTMEISFFSKSNIKVPEPN